jgi:hypothetical protein
MSSKWNGNFLENRIKKEIEIFSFEIINHSILLFVKKHNFVKLNSPSYV